MKKKKLFILIFISLFTLPGCKEISKLTKFDFPVSETFDIPASTALPILSSLSNSTVETNYQASFDQHNVSKNLVESITLKSLSITINSPENDDFSYLKSIEITMSADNLPDKKVAFKTSVPSNVGKTLVFDVNDTIDLKEYIFSGNIKLSIAATTTKSNSNENVTANAVFNVDAKILGL